MASRTDGARHDAVMRKLLPRLTDGRTVRGHCQQGLQFRKKTINLCKDQFSALLLTLEDITSRLTIVLLYPEDLKNLPSSN